MCSKVLGRTGLLVMVAIAVCAGSARASFIPSGVDLWFTSSVPTISFRNGLRLVTPGSVMSTDGTVVASNQALLSKFRPAMNFVPLLNDKNLDALAVTGSSRRKTIVFSTRKGFYSNTLHRYISDGDLLNNRGQLVATQQELLSDFQPRNTNLNYGLSTAYIATEKGHNGKPDIVFSTDRSFYSNKLKRTINAGDIISNTGDVVVTFSEMLQSFAPRGNINSLGLDTFFVLFDKDGRASNYLFSTKKRFYSTTLKRWVPANSLLNSDGTIAMSEEDVLSRFGFLVPVCGNMELHAAAFSIPGSNGDHDSSWIHHDPPKPRPVPEPTTLGLAALGLIGLIRRRK